LVPRRVLQVFKHLPLEKHASVLLCPSLASREVWVVKHDPFEEFFSNVYLLLRQKPMLYVASVFFGLAGRLLNGHRHQEIEVPYKELEGLSFLVLED